MGKLKFLLLILFSVSCVAQTNGFRDPDFNIFPLPQGNFFVNHPIFYAKSQPDGRVLVLHGEGNDIMELISLDNNIGTRLGKGFNNEIKSFDIQPDGKILLMGTFTTFEGVPVGRVSRLNIDGTLDASFSSITALNGLNNIMSMGLQPYRKIIINLQTGLIRLHADGTLDSGFNTVSSDILLTDMEFLSNGKIIIAGTFSVINGTAVNNIARLNADGTLDDGFVTGTGFNSSVQMLTVQPDEKILVGGNFTSYNGSAANKLIRLQANGSIDNTFSSGIPPESSEIWTSLIQPDGKIIVGGYFGSYSGNSNANNLIRLNPDGTLDSAFGSNNAFNGAVYCLVQKVDGKIFVGGSFTYNDLPVNHVIQLNPDGTRDEGFNNIGAGFDGSVIGMAVQPDNKIITTGSFRSYNGTLNKGIVRLNPDGSLDNTFNPDIELNPQILLSRICVLPDMKILVSGIFNNYNGVALPSLVRLNSNGTLDQTFHCDPTVGVVDIIVQPDGKIITSGQYDRVKRLNVNGTLDNSFVSTSLGIQVTYLTLQPDGKIIVNGRLSQGEHIIGMLRLDTNGLRDPSFTIDPALIETNIYEVVQIQPDGKILALSDEWNKVIRINTDGSLDPSFNDTSADQTDYRLGFQLLPDGKILVHTEDRLALYKLNSDGSPDSSFPNGSIHFNGAIKATALLSDGDIILAGHFDEYNGLPERRIVRLTGDEFYSFAGTNRLDSNNNGCSASDPLFSNLNFRVTGSENSDIIANGSGSFSYLMKPGQYTFTPTFENPQYFNVQPTSVSVDFPAQGNLSGQDFCITPNGQYADLEVTVIPTTAARPGFDATYIIAYKNKGNQTLSGTLNFQFNDRVIDLESANPAVNSQSSNLLSWNFSALRPFETRTIVVVLYLNNPSQSPPLSGGEILSFSATVTSPQTDQTPGDNIFTLVQTVVNSLDPNDKTCLEGAKIAPEKIGDYVHYLIRFENKGTYAAQNIIVADNIDTEKFDINTLVPLNGSHLFVTKIEGNKASFIFENINLPYNDADNDGYVAFKIKTKSTLANGDTFSNTASIYFDYNFPIVTNTATTTIAALATTDFAFENYFRVYPNPASEILMLHNKKNIGLKSIEVYSVTGQRVLVIPNAKELEKLDVSVLKSGSYFIKIHTEKGSSNIQFLKK